MEVVGDTMGVDKGTVCRAVKDITNALLARKDQFIKWPTQEQREKSKQLFFRRGGFPDVFGCLDGTHVRVQAPSGNLERDFINRKGFHSVNVQSICDHEGKCINVDAQWPGSTHDSYIFRASDVSSYLEHHHRAVEDGFLLGDSGYTLSKFLLTPYLPQSTPSQEAYNTVHTRTRCTIDRVFGWWKRRFHILHGEMRLRPGKVCQIVGVCAILHDIAIMLNEPMEDENLNDCENEAAKRDFLDREDGRAIRNYITRSYF